MIILIQWFVLKIISTCFRFRDIPIRFGSTEKLLMINSIHGAESMQSGSPAGRAVAGCCSHKLNSKNLSRYLTKHCCGKVKQSEHYAKFILLARYTESSVFLIDFTVKPGFKSEAPLQWQHVFFLLHAWICL